MKYLELRRHSMRAIPGPHLTQAGVNLARRLGEQMGPFAWVVTSPRPRAYETAIAMGFAVHEQREVFAVQPDVVIEQMYEPGQPGPASFVQWAAAAQVDADIGQFVRAQAEALRELLDELDDGEAALVVSHGGIVEAGAVGCVPQHDWAADGGAVNYCEGVRLSFDSARDQFVQAEVLRVVL